jgi:hypothetical protein
MTTEVDHREPTVFARKKTQIREFTKQLARPRDTRLKNHVAGSGPALGTDRNGPFLRGVKKTKLDNWSRQTIGRQSEARCPVAASESRAETAASVSRHSGKDVVSSMRRSVRGPGAPAFSPSSHSSAVPLRYTKENGSTVARRTTRFRFRS